MVTVIILSAICGMIIGSSWNDYKHRFDHCPQCGGHTHVEMGYDYRYDDQIICDDCGHVLASRWHV